MSRTTLFVGLDLGQASDFSALVIAERTLQAAPEQVGKLEGHYAVRYLQRWVLGTGYPVIVQDVGKLLARPPLSVESPLVVDGSGVGRAVVDMFRPLGRRLVPVTIHGGAETSLDDETHYWRVPKRELVGVVQVLLQSGRLRIAPSLPEAPTLTHELKIFKAKISAGGHDSYGAAESGGLPDDWREGPHDDLVLGLALALWYAERAPKPRPFTSAVGGERPNWNPPLRDRRTDNRLADESQQSVAMAAQLRAGRAAGWRTS